MRAWHQLEPQTVQSHPLFGRGGGLAICIAYWVLYLPAQVGDLYTLSSFLAEATDHQRPYVLASIAVLGGLTAYLLHTFYIGLRKIPDPEGGFRFDARFPRRIIIFLGLYLLLGALCPLFGLIGPSRGYVSVGFFVTLHGVRIFLEPIPFIFYFMSSSRVRVTYLNQVHGYDPFLKTAAVLDPEPLTPEMVRDRDLWTAVMNSAVPADIRTDIESKWADDAKRGRLGKRARDYLIEIHETYRGPYTPQSA